MIPKQGDGVKACSIHISDGKIAKISSVEDSPIDSLKVEDDCLVLPGLVDSHVHVNEPGRTSWEGFETATKTAAVGGVTCIADMPLNSIPPTTTLDNLNQKIDAAKGKVQLYIFR